MRMRRMPLKRRPEVAAPEQLPYAADKFAVADFAAAREPRRRPRTTPRRLTTRPGARRDRRRTRRLRSIAVGQPSSADRSNARSNAIISSCGATPEHSRKFLLEKIANGWVEIALRGPRDVVHGRWSLARWAYARCVLPRRARVRSHFRRTRCGGDEQQEDPQRCSP
jgi:hypothetical protein